MCMCDMTSVSRALMRRVTSEVRHLMKAAACETYRGLHALHANAMCTESGCSLSRLVARRSGNLEGLPELGARHK
jgi:hypothetical protein